jgi:alpha-beta hydrolase superfamily lysophospholipase
MVSPMVRLLGAWLVTALLAWPQASGATGGLPALKEKCGDTSGVSAQPFALATSDGVSLYAIEAGSGPVAVVLAHESPASLCGWLPYIPSLTASGLRVLAFDFRGFGDSTVPAGVPYRAYDRDLAAIVARARNGGARRVFLMGASYGGAIALTYAPRLRLDGVISLSGETYLPSAKANALDSAPRLRAPLLVVGSRHDRYLPVKDALALIRRAGSKDKRTALYPGGWHGWAIVEEAPYAADARLLILAWIRARS